MRDSVQEGAGRKKESTNPTAIPGREITSGMIRWSRSMKVMTIRAAVKAKKAKKLTFRPNFRKRATAKAPVSASTRGYRQEIFAPQLRHFPRRRRKLTRGILSYPRT